MTCKDHRHGTFCGLCLQAPLYPNPDADLHVGVHENEDEETWPSVETTCRSCREDALLKRVWTHPELREAVGGRTFDAEDWETRYVIDAFLDTADGTIEEVVRTARDKHWLRRHTRLAELLRLAILSWQLSYRNGDDRRIEPEDEEDDLDTDWDDPELLSMTEEREGVRDLAMSDWARSRIMDGHWLNPADSFYRYTNNGRPTHVQAVHPFPFTGESMVEQLDQHPAESLVVVPPPPTLELCETAYRAHVKQMRSILAPALSNVMRKLVIECAEDGADAVVRAARMEIEDVVAELREAGVWYKGMDWLEHRRSTRDEADRQERRDRRVIDEDADSDSSSNKSNTTSPVLSTTTVATTPSPPPSSRGTTKESDDEIESTRVPIPVSPVLNPPTLLAHIPFVPVTTTHLPHHSMEVLKTVRIPFSFSFTEMLIAVCLALARSLRSPLSLPLHYLRACQKNSHRQRTHGNHTHRELSQSTSIRRARAGASEPGRDPRAARRRLRTRTRVLRRGLRPDPPHRRLRRRLR